MGAPDGVTLDLSDCAADYGRRAEKLGLERRNVLDLQHAMNHAEFKKRHHQLLDELAAEYARSLPLIERPPFIVARVGTLKTGADYRQSLAVTDPVCNISKWAGDITDKQAFSASIPQVEEDVEFVWASNEELGYPNGCTRLQTYEAGLKLGWKLCLASDGYEIRHRYLNQPKGEWMFVAMEPITDSDGGLWVFHIGHGDDGLWLHAYYGHPDDVWGGYYHWVFRRK